jgi:prepilin-type N-terminal cleavage/methylation domain-containing protein
MKKKSRAAFSLIELMVVIAIIGLVTITLVQFMTHFMNVKFNAEMMQRIRQEGNYALDQIDFLIRNSLTIPDVCVNQKAEVFYQPATDSLDFEYLGCPQTALRTNTQAQGSGQFQRSLVFLPAEVNAPYLSSGCGNNNVGTLGSYISPQVESNQIMLFQPLELGSDASGVTRHNDPNFTAAANKIALTSSLAGSSGTVPFKVTDLQFTCGYDDFAGGWAVTTEFYISYNRRTLSRDASIDNCYDNSDGRLLDKVGGTGDCELAVEKFTRTTAIRNNYPFEF